MNIEKIVSAGLVGASEQYLREIVDHGIHNLTNRFHGESDDDYRAFADEFNKQARAMLGE